MWSRMRLTRAAGWPSLVILYIVICHSHILSILGFSVHILIISHISEWNGKLILRMWGLQEDCGQCHKNHRWR